MPELTSTNQELKIRRLSVNRQWLQIAAVTLLALTAVYWLWIKPANSAPQEMVEVFTGNEERQQLVLPDGSEVWLNEDSKITYLKSFQERKINTDRRSLF